jgi:polysaccharide biosynthesis protein PelC
VCRTCSSPTTSRSERPSARRLGAVVASLLALGIASCATPEPTAFVHPRADLSIIHRVAVLPFESLTGEREAGRKVQDLFTVELLSLDAFDVAEPGEVVRGFAKAGLDPNISLDPADFKKLGDTLKVQAFFVGAVSEYRERQIGTLNAPEVAISVRLVEVESGQVLWSGAGGRSGLDWATRLFGVKERSLQQSTLEAVRDVLHTLVEPKS